jgi:hypothetical protein
MNTQETIKITMLQQKLNMFSYMVDGFYLNFENMPKTEEKIREKYNEVRTRFKGI